MKFIFVGGCGRSGTTPVQKILSSHSRIVGGPEFDFTIDIMNLYDKMNSPFFLNRQKFFYNKDFLSGNIRSFYSSFFEMAFRRKPGAEFVSEKTPVNINVAETLLMLFPDSYFVNVIRDGRDVLVSHFEVNRRYKQKAQDMGKGFSTQSICSIWNSAIDKYFSLKNNEMLSGRVFSVCYEQLVRNPNEEIKKLTAFLGLEFEAEMLHPEKILAQTNKIEMDDIWYTREQYEQPLNASKIGRWKKELTFIQRIEANHLMKENLRRLGYPV
ncbi:MAG TPA: sulfotransferase [Bacteroidia bacterium]